MAGRKPTALEMTFLMGWHGVLSGAFIVAFVTMDGPMGMHFFAGYVVIFAILIRLLIASVVATESPLYVPRPSLTATARYFAQTLTGDAKGRNPLIAWMAAALLISIGLASLSGLMAETMRGLDDFHEGLAMASPAVIGAHMAFVLLGHWLRSIKKLARRPTAPARTDSGATRPAPPINY